MDELPRRNALWRTPAVLVAGTAGTLLVLHGLIRAGLLARFGGEGLGLAQAARSVLAGTVVDVFAVLAATLPLAGLVCLGPKRLFRGWGRHVVTGLLAAGMALTIFLAAAEFFFFEEFLSRFNTVAVDYLLYPHEVFINILDTYPVGWVVAGTMLLALGWAAGLAKIFPQRWEQALNRRQRLALGAVWLGGLAGLWPVVGNQWTRISDERVLNEITGNGWYSFAQAAVTRELEYAPFYKTMDLDAAYARTRQLLAEPGARFQETGRSLARKIEGDAGRPKLNVVVLLEESLGSEFFGCLGRTEPTCTPRLDGLSREGLLFTNIYASGNRTVRGMEAVLCSFPPLPGDSVVVRSGGKPIETLARVLERDGYDTTFLYAGRGIFDHIRPFMTTNGYQHFVEQKDYANPAFSTIWGVSNEDLYQRGLEECRRAAEAGKPFFVTMLSVSNHKPFTYPKGRIAENPDERSRQNAVKYTDFAIGQFFDRAQKESFWTNTVFVVVADHGARVYGRQTIPMKSYEIPFLVLGPAAVAAPERIGTPGGQVDVAPTILGLIGRPYESTFFGRDLRRMAEGTGRSLLHHNRDIGLYEKGELVVLGLNKTAEHFHGDAKHGGLAPEPAFDEAARSVEADAEAIFQVADDLYRQEKYVVAKPQNLEHRATATTMERKAQATEAFN